MCVRRVRPHILTKRPHAARGRSEQPVKAVQLWERPFAFENGDLLSEGEDLNRSVMPAAEEDADSGQEGKNEFEREQTGVACRKAIPGSSRGALPAC